MSTHFPPVGSMNPSSDKSKSNSNPPNSAQLHSHLDSPSHSHSAVSPSVSSASSITLSSSSPVHLNPVDHAPTASIIHSWCHQHAEPLLSQYLEQWCIMNATHMITTIVQKQIQHQLQPIHQQLQLLLLSQNANTNSKYRPHSPPPFQPPPLSPYSPPPLSTVGAVQTSSASGNLGLPSSGTRRTSPLALTVHPQHATRNSTSAHPSSISSGLSSLSSFHSMVDDHGNPHLANSSIINGAPLDVRNLMRQRLNSQAAAAFGTGSGGSATHSMALISSPPSASTIMNVSMLSPNSSPSTSSSLNSAHSNLPRPLGLGFGRSSPEYFSSSTNIPLNLNGVGGGGGGGSSFTYLKRPSVMELISSDSSSVGPGEEVMREASPNAYHATSSNGSMLSSNMLPLPIIRESSGTSQSGGGSRRMSISSSTSVLGLGLTDRPNSAMSHHSSSHPTLHPIDILVVEDVRVAQKLAHVALTRAHFRVDIVGSGEAAIERVRALAAIGGGPKVILMDIHLPGMSGIEATERIRKLENELYGANTNGSHHIGAWIYGLTASVEPDELLRYKLAGMNGCILKGRILADSVRLAMDENERHPYAFVNLAEKDSSTGSASTPLMTRSIGNGVSGSSGVGLASPFSHSPLPLPLGTPMVLSGGGVIGRPTSPMVPSTSSPSGSTTGMGSEATNNFGPTTASSATSSSTTTSPAPVAHHQANATSDFIVHPSVGHEGGGGGRGVGFSAAPATIGTPTPDFSLLTVGAGSDHHSPTPLHLLPRKLVTSGGVGSNSMNGNNSIASPPSSSFASLGNKRSATSMLEPFAIHHPLPSPTTHPISPIAHHHTQHAGHSTNSHPYPSSSSLISPSLHGIDVLLVEDVRVAQRIAQRALTSAGYRVDVASSGEAAIERFKLHFQTIKIVLMDINLPGMSGVEATEVMRRYESDIRSATNANGNGDLNTNSTNSEANHHMTTWNNNMHPVPSSSSSLSSSPLNVAPPRILIFGLTGNTDDASLRLYEEAGMNGCIAKGTTIGSAVRAAVEAANQAPGQFIHLSSSITTSGGTSTSSAYSAAASSSSAISSSSSLSSSSSSSSSSTLISTRHSPMPTMIRIIRPSPSPSPSSSSYSTISSSSTTAASTSNSATSTSIAASSSTSSSLCSSSPVDGVPTLSDCACECHILSSSLNLADSFSFINSSSSCDSCPCRHHRRPAKRAKIESFHTNIPSIPDSLHTTIPSIPTSSSQSTLPTTLTLTHTESDSDHRMESIDAESNTPKID